MHSMVSYSILEICSVPDSDARDRPFMEQCVMLMSMATARHRIRILFYLKMLIEKVMVH